MVADKVRVSGSLYLPWVLVKSEEKTKSKFTAMFRVKAPPSRSNAAPIHLVVVLDVCGRIGQQRADLLKTMLFIRELHGDAAAKDQIDIVDAPLMPNDQTRTIDGWISEAQAGNQENVMPKSGTVLSLLLDHAVEILRDKSSDGVKRVGFILLLSDRQSEKLKFDDSRVKKLRKYPVHVLDLGSNHDPEMLYSIAQTSRGTYSSIAAAADLDNNKKKKNKKDSKLLEAVAICLGGLKSVVAINTRVTMSVEVDDDTHGNNIKDDINIKIQPGDKDIGVLYAGEVKDLIVDINLNTRDISSRTRSATLTATVEYEVIRSSPNNKQKQAEALECKLPLLVTGTSNGPALEAYEKLPPNSMVLQRMIMLEVLEMLVNFAKEHSTPTTGDLLLSTWDKAKKKQGKNLQVAQKMSDLMDDLRKINNDMKTMASCLQRSEGEGLSCIYSWVSSYQMQRGTTTGLPFLTPAMEEAARNVSKQQASVERAIMLLEYLERLFDSHEQKHNSSNLETFNFVKKVHEAVKAAINGGTRTMPAAAAATTTPTLDDDLKDRIKSTIAKRLFDSASEDDDLPKIYEAAEVAINYWLRVQGAAPPAQHQ